MKLALIGIGIAVIIGIAAVDALSVNEPEPEQPTIKRAVPKEPTPQTSQQPTQSSQPSTQQAQPTKPRCDPSYPDGCIASYPPDLDCDEISHANFRVTGSDPHGFDNDRDGIGCEKSSSSSQTQQSTQSAPAPAKDCDPSYPTVCIPSYPPDLNCGDISYKRFKVLQPDPHGFDRDRDGIGCES